MTTGGPDMPAAGIRMSAEIFIRLGLLVAAIILLAGLLLMAKDALGIRFWDLIPADIPILAGGIAVGLTGIGLFSLAAYGFVRAIGSAIDRSV
jgi:hypothetical protein